MSRVIGAVLIAVIVLLGPAGPALADDSFEGLESGRRVYDETAAALTDPQRDELERRLDQLDRDGLADVVVVVHELDADPEDTLEQAQALQQQWVSDTGADRGTAVGIVINREPGTGDEARAGLYVGRTLNQGDVPDYEQQAIVDDVLIPPLRSGNVDAAITGTIDRLRDDLTSGPPPEPATPFERWATAHAWWITSVAAVLALLGAATIVATARRQSTIGDPKPPATTQRPSDLPPAMAGTLARGTPPGSASAATVVDLAGRGDLELVFQPDRGLLVKKDRVAVRLRGSSGSTGAVDRIVHDRLERYARRKRVSHDYLQLAVARARPAVIAELRAETDVQGWRDADHRQRLGLLIAVGSSSALAALILGIVAGASSSWRLALGAVLLGAVAVGAFVVGRRDSPLTAEGQRAALPWVAYRDGLTQATKDPDQFAAALDDPRTPADLVAFSLTERSRSPLARAGQSGRTLAAFAALAPEVPVTSVAQFWTALNTSLSGSSSSDGSMAGGGGGGDGGGGASGST